MVELAAAPSDDWLAVAAGRKGDLPEAARHVLTAVDQVRFAHVYDGSTLAAIGRGTVTGSGRWLGLCLIEVLPAARRQGLATRVIRALADWAAEVGATDAFLQVEQRNTPACALYRKLGFTTHHTYLTRVAPNPPPGPDPTGGVRAADQEVSGSSQGKTSPLGATGNRAMETLRPRSVIGR